jgi:hypothetical protein
MFWLHFGTFFTKSSGHPEPKQTNRSFSMKNSGKQSELLLCPCRSNFLMKKLVEHNAKKLLDTID